MKLAHAEIVLNVLAQMQKFIGIKKMRWVQ